MKNYSHYCRFGMDLDLFYFVLCLVLSLQASMCHYAAQVNLPIPRNELRTFCNSCYRRSYTYVMERMASICVERLKRWHGLVALEFITYYRYYLFLHICITTL